MPKIKVFHFSKHSCACKIPKNDQNRCVQKSSAGSKPKKSTTRTNGLRGRLMIRTKSANEIGDCRARFPWGLELFLFAITFAITFASKVIAKVIANLSQPKIYHRVAAG